MTYMQQSGPEPTREELDAMPGPVVVEFGAEWCPHCQAAQPALKQLLDADPTVKHLKVEDGRGKPLGRSFAVKLWPTIIILRNGEQLARVTRPSDAELAEAFAKLK